jgi:hypothetical protein
LTSGPVINLSNRVTCPDYWERAAFPYELVPKLKQLGIGGGTIKGHGCAVSGRVVLLQLEPDVGQASHL